MTAGAKPTDVPESTNKLLSPCPFCGSRAIGPRENTVLHHWIVECINVFCCANVNDHSQETVVKAWNRRTPAASPVAPPESDEKITRLEQWLDQTANLLNLYAHGFCPKDVALGLLTKIKTNWPDMLDDINPLASPVAGGSAETDEVKPFCVCAEVGDDRCAVQCAYCAGGCTDADFRAMTAHPEVAGGSDVEMLARRLMWLGHGHRGIYGDDGEMQCIECLKFRCIDYKNAPLEEVKSAYEAAQLERYSEAMSKLVPEGWVKVTPETMPPERERVLADYENHGVEISSWFQWETMEEPLWAPGIREWGRVRRWHKLPVPAAEEERSSL